MMLRKADRAGMGIPVRGLKQAHHTGNRIVAALCALAAAAIAPTSPSTKHFRGDQIKSVQDHIKTQALQ